MSEIYKSYRVAAVIDLGALENNIGIIRQRAGKSKITAVVKADAYGHRGKKSGNAYRALCRRLCRGNPRGRDRAERRGHI